MAGLNQTATPNPVVDFVPTKQYPSFSGIINESITVLANLATALTLLFSDVLGGFITSNNAAAQTLTLPTAALLVPQIEGAQVGSSIRFFVKALGAGTITVAAGTGGTMVGTATIATGQIKEFLLRVTAVGNTPTYDCISLGTSTY